ncbi:MAG: hypothetical protein GF401_16530 [Chitinivibrionales bacterium]|nr:hypothetical protein [Chitinivibrionales bacterium]
MRLVQLLMFIKDCKNRNITYIYPYFHKALKYAIIKNEKIMHGKINTLLFHFKWLRRLLKRRSPAGRRNPPGLILIQVDGLSKSQFERALQNKRMPFISRLLNREDYHLYSHYSGLPSSTPSVQGELFYGVKTSVPSFGFKDREKKHITSMFTRKTATAVEENIARKGEPLLSDGSSYADVYTGSARVSHFCLSSFHQGPKEFINSIPGMFRSPYSMVLYVAAFARAAVLTVIETALAVMDFLRGVLTRHSFVKELSFIPPRIAICGILREFVKAHVMSDISRGIPIIHANFPGYDEQSHRRGPSSSFAHWTLQGIDASIGAIWHKAHASSKREYDVWIYSDHGQEDTIPYGKLHNRNILESVRDAAAIAGFGADFSHNPFQSIMRKRTVLLYPGTEQQNVTAISGHNSNALEMAGLGPLMHIYFEKEIDQTAIKNFAHALIDHAAIPLVLQGKNSNRITALNSTGEWQLPKDIDRVIGQDHPFKDEIKYDLIQLVHHPNAGDLIMCGWQPHSQAISFPHENGAHAGLGTEETHGFCCTPASVPFNEITGRSYLRPLDIRKAALQHLGRAPLIRKKDAVSATDSHLRIMTYNIHSCIGIDGTVSPERVARVIARYNPDIVTLQELECNRNYTGNVDQADTIARLLDMKFHFHPANVFEDGVYGNAVLSKRPTKKVRTISLPGWHKTEPRSALYIKLNHGGKELSVVATHMSFYPAERHQQCEYLLFDQKIGELDACVVCGDFNMVPRSKTYRMITQVFRDAHTASYSGKNRTWMGLTCLDYLFVSKGVEVKSITVPRDSFIRKVSDHAPVIADIIIR